MLTIAQGTVLCVAYTVAYSDLGLTSGAYLYHTTNELGKTTTYGHNLPTGAQTSVTDANNNATYYYYNDNYTKLLKTESNGTSVSYTYNGNRISQILFNGGSSKQETYSFGYDSFGNVTSTSVGSKSLVTNTYGSNNGLLQKSAYANGDAIRYAYTNSGLVSQIFVDNNATSANPSFTWNYSSNGLPRAHKDGITGYKYDYSYDSIGRLIRTDISKSSDSSYVASTEYGYDVRNNLTSIVNDIGGIAYKQIYGYYNTGVGNAAEDTKDNLPTRYIVLGVNTDYYYNSLNQLYKREVGISSNPITNTYTYNTVTLDNTLYYTNQLAREDIENDKYYYTYDNVGNITLIQKAVGTGSATNYREYSYDNLNRLKTETLNGSTLNEWTYDGLGNILTKTTTVGSTKTGLKYNYGASSNCGWENLLTSIETLVYNSDGSETVTKTENIYYDAIGNPYSYRGIILGWNGRQLLTYTKDSTTISMGYDADGLRSTKTVAGVKTTYQYVGDKLFYEDRGNGDSFYYFYDSYGKLAALYHHRNGVETAYHVVTNAQGDVVALYSWTGTKVAEYSYDAWGNCTIVSDTSSTGIATLNPFRYRGYYFDTDLGLYYLQSRYYDAEIGRFINADNQIAGVGGDIQGYNMYSYCTNNPVIKKDSEGTSEETLRFNEGGSISTIFAVFALLVLGCYSLTTITACPPKTLSLPEIDLSSKADAAAEADQKIKDTVKQDSKDRYWKADRGTDKIVRISEPISFDEAVAEVSAGRSVFAVTQVEAYEVAFVAGGDVEPVVTEIHGKGAVGYYYHYHTAGHGKGHVWYLF